MPYAGFDVGFTKNWTRRAFWAYHGYHEDADPSAVQGVLRREISMPVSWRSRCVTPSEIEADTSDNARPKREEKTNDEAGHLDNADTKHGSTGGNHNILRAGQVRRQKCGGLQAKVRFLPWGRRQGRHPRRKGLKGSELRGPRSSEIDG